MAAWKQRAEGKPRGRGREKGQQGAWEGSEKPGHKAFQCIDGQQWLCNKQVQLERDWKSVPCIYQCQNQEWPFQKKKEAERAFLWHEEGYLQITVVGKWIEGIKVACRLHFRMCLRTEGSVQSGSGIKAPKFITRPLALMGTRPIHRLYQPTATVQKEREEETQWAVLGKWCGWTVPDCHGNRIRGQSKGEQEGAQNVGIWAGAEVEGKWGSLGCMVHSTLFWVLSSRKPNASTYQ